MLGIANLSIIRPNSASSLSISLTKTPSANPFLYFCFGVSPMASSKAIAEYARSSRSSCKKCSNPISANALRLGLVSRDSRGFDTTRWHHVDCFPLDSKSVASAEAIKGFSALKNTDQEALKEMVARSLEKVPKGSNAVTEESKESVKEIHKLDKSEGEFQEIQCGQIRKLDESEENEIQERKKVKYSQLHVHSEEAKLEISFSVSDIGNTYKGATLLPKWKAFQTIIFLERDDGLHDSGKIAAFDFDGCLAKTSVKRVGPAAWSLMYPSIPEKLQSLYNDGYKLVIFTNESNIDRWKNKRQVAVDSKIGRLNNFINCVKVPIQVFIACGVGKSDGKAEDPFRKPRPGMWQIMERQFNSGISIDMDQSFYVGDAAGRPDDHSDADIKFAEAIGLKFYVPEEYFGA